MGGSLNFKAPTVLEYFAALVAEDASLSVLEAAIAVAQDEDAGLDTQTVLAQVDELAERLRRRLPADAAPLQRLRQLNAYFFQELGFAGNLNHYDDRRNSYLPEVLHTRRGIPLTLAILYIEIASALGLKAQGVGFPGHFLVKLHMPRGEIIIDPFTGHSLSREALEERLLPYRQQRPGLSEDEAPLALFLQVATARDMIARLLRNLKNIHRSAGDWPRLAAVMRRLVILLPLDWAERRDRGLAMAQIGRPDLAVSDLNEYLAHCPGAQDGELMRRHLARWQQTPGTRLQ